MASAILHGIKHRYRYLRFRHFSSWKVMICTDYGFQLEWINCWRSAP
ncbi:hypothetical protein SLEP1_g1438 [Rubroshorea leprosula]|uniref:Uncharacterized protein n=1 Tax=Rubroshorea leprosula TaxID=152421 RepID=A0AAV5HJN7_9ROSI|nr:hypothetical protein SLEP1_g1438 [Rubroshorea leprosula]